MSTKYTFQTAAEAIAEGREIIESIAAATGWPIVEGCLIPEPGTWHADDGNAEIVEEHESGRAAAESYVADGEWGDRSETTWVTVAVWREGIDGDGDTCRVDESSHKVTIEPEEPECEQGQEHDWQAPHSIVGGLKENPGVYGHHGGVTIQEVCLHCGCGKLTDTWAQDSSDGEQGLRSVSYEPGKYSAQIQRDEEER